MTDFDRTARNDQLEKSAPAATATARIEQIAGAITENLSLHGMDVNDPVVSNGVWKMAVVIYGAHVAHDLVIADLLRLQEDWTDIVLAQHLDAFVGQLPSFSSENLFEEVLRETERGKRDAEFTEQRQRFTRRTEQQVDPADADKD